MIGTRCTREKIGLMKRNSLRAIKGQKRALELLAVSWQLKSELRRSTRPWPTFSSSHGQHGTAEISAFLWVRKLVLNLYRNRRRSNGDAMRFEIVGILLQIERPFLMRAWTPFNGWVAFFVILLHLVTTIQCRQGQKGRLNPRRRPAPSLSPLTCPLFEDAFLTLQKSHHCRRF